jgi:hypothetical protein
MGGKKSVMTFFVTSRGLPKGADARDLAAADAHCQALAAAEGAGDHTWRAYMGARDQGRIGSGPWYNAEGTLVAANLQALVENKNAINKDDALTEKADSVDPNAPGLFYCFGID